MKKVGFAFEFEPPGRWVEFRDGARFVFQGPGGEELIVSGYVIEGSGAGPDLAGVRRRLFEGAVSSAEDAASHPELEVTAPLNHDERITNCECWRLSARTLDRETLFEEAIFVGERAVLLVTFESPNNEEAEAGYTRFLRTVRSSPH
jgi:hypothetical protein